MMFQKPHPINVEDQCAAFSCGEHALDEWLRRRALANEKAGASRCFVTSNNNTVVGYYALAAGSVERRFATGRLARNMPDPIPVIVLARLAVDQTVQGKGLGAGLLTDAIVRVLSAAEHIGAKALLVHAMHDHAAQFYLQQGFSPFPENPLHLYRTLNELRTVVPEISS